MVARDAVVNGAGAIVPVAVGAAAIACALFERARGPRGEAISTPVAALGAACALVLYPLALPTDADRRALVVAAAFAGALWLAGRAEDDPRLAPLFLGAAGAVAGARLALGLALAPLVLPAFFAAARSSGTGRPGRGRALAGAVIVFAAGHAAGLLAFGRGAATSTLAPSLSTSSMGAHLVTWWLAAAHAVGPAALALAGLGVVLALGASGLRGRGALAAVLLVALGAEACIGAGAGPNAGPISSLSLSLGVGLFVVEAGARLVSHALRGAELTLIPLALLALAEPLSVRLRAAKLTFPTLGPVPPRAPAPWSRR